MPFRPDAEDARALTMCRPAARLLFMTCRLIRAAALGCAAHLAALTGVAVAQDRPLPPDQLPAAEAPTPPPGQMPKAAEQPEDREVVLDRLYKQLAAATSPAEAQPIAEAIQRLKLISGSATTDVLMDRASTASDAKNNDLAIKFLDTVLELQPGFVEGWNRRALLHFRNDDTKRALGDIRRALALDPRNLGALSGLGEMLRHVGEKRGALAAYKKLYELYPLADGLKSTIDELTRDVEGQGI